MAQVPSAHFLNFRFLQSINSQKCKFAKVGKYENHRLPSQRGASAKTTLAAHLAVTIERSSYGPAVAALLTASTLSLERAAPGMSTPSLQTYLLVNPETRGVERYGRASNWARQVLSPNDPLAIAAIGFSCEQQRIFAAL
jgi:hypothetical protein